LTNYSISKKNTNVPKEETEGMFAAGSEYSMEDLKWSLETLEKFFAHKGWDFNSLLGEIHEIILKTIISGHAKNYWSLKKNVKQTTNCFELFGFDVLVDSDMKPWLMEVNISPALKGSCDMDYALKQKLIRDVFNTVGFRISDIAPLKAKNAAVPIPIGHGINDHIWRLSINDIKMLAIIEDEVCLY
jgi:hypothetical protein